MTRQFRDPYDETNVAVRLIWGGLRFVLFAFVLIAFFTALLIFYNRWQTAQAGDRITLDAGSPDLSAAESTFLQLYLALNRGQLIEPAGAGRDVIPFNVAVGQNANQIAINLSSAGVLDPRKESLFLNYLRFYGLDAQLAAGDYDLSPTFDIPTLAETLTSGGGNDITVTFLEGWRAEQMVDYLAEVRPASVDPAEFSAIIRRDIPIDTSPYAFLAEVGPTSSLEGFLFPDTYRLPQDANAAYLVNLMLQTFDRRVTPEMRQGFGLNGLTIRQAVTLASIVEREAVLAEEQPLIAGVFYNRLTQGMRLDADPTVQYALGYDAIGNSWWKVPLTFEDLRTDSPFNTYRVTGLPPAPIANPGLGALQAVAEPASTDYLYFVAGCPDLPPSAHRFSLTLEEHNANVAACLP